jgi:hypothetical protein
MNEIIDDKPSPKSLVITLHRTDLLKDIDEKAYLISQTTDNRTDQQRAAIADIEQDGQSGILNEYINEAWAEILHAISGYIPKSLDADTTDNSNYNEYDTFTCQILATINFNANAIPAVKNALKNYLEDYALGMYLSITDKTNATIFLSKADDDKWKLKKYLASGVRPWRLRYFPSW